MNMLIIAGLMAIALLAIIGAITLAASVEKTPAATQKTPMQTPATPTETKKELAPVQSLPTAPNDARMAFVNGQFHELVAQLRTLHQQSQEIERRLSILSQAAEAITRSQSPSFSIEETEEYRLPEPVGSGV